MSYIHLAPSGIKTSHHIIPMLVRSTIPLHGEVNIMATYGSKTNQ